METSRRAREVRGRGKQARGGRRARSVLVPCVCCALESVGADRQVSKWHGARLVSIRHPV